MNYISNLIKISALSLLLTACGGGGSPKGIPDNSPDIPTEYTGLRSPAVLDPTLSRTTAADYFVISDIVRTFLFSELYTTEQDFFESGLNISESCANGGSSILKTSGSGPRGVFSYQFNNCVADNNERVNGNLSFNVNFDTSKITITLSKLSFSDNAVSLSMHGSFVSTNVVPRGKIVNVNLLINKAHQQLLVENLRIPYYLAADDTTHNVDLTGDFYYSDKGKITTSLASQISYELIFTGNDKSSIPVSGGPLLVEDQLGNKASFKPLSKDDVEIKFISAESPETELYAQVPWEQIEIQNTNGGQNPTANESFTGTDNLLVYSRYQDFRRYGNQETPSPVERIQLDGSLSLDPEGALLEFNWELIESPIGSTVEFTEINTAFPILSPNFLGKYVIRLIVSDGKLQSEPVIIQIHIGGSNFDPFDVFGEPSWKATQPSGEIVLQDEHGHIKPLTTLEVFPQAFNDIYLPEFLKFTINWELISKPSQSNATLLDSTEVKSRFTPDVIGDYVFNVTVSNGFKTFTRTQTIVVYDFEAIAIPYIDYSFGRTLSKVGQKQTSKFVYKAEVGPREFTTTLSLLDKPMNSNPQYTITTGTYNSDASADVDFILDKQGRYLYQLEASNGASETHPVDVILYALDSTPAQLEEVIRLPLKGLSSLTVGDINHDGFNDVVVTWFSAGYENKYQILFGEGNDNYASSQVFNAPSTQIVGLYNLDGDPNLELIFAGIEGNLNGGGIVIVDFDTEDPFGLGGTEQKVGRPDFLLDNWTPILARSYYKLYSVADINADGFKDLIWLHKKIVNANNYETVAYSLKTTNGTFSAPIVLEGVSGEVQNITFNEGSNRLLVLSKSNVGHLIPNKPIEAKIEEFEFSATRLIKKSSFTVEYLVGAPIHSDIFPWKSYFYDLDGDGNNEIIGEFTTGGHHNTAIWKKNSSTSSYQISQKIVSQSDLSFADIDSDGDIDIVQINQSRRSFVLLQNSDKQFDSAKEFVWDVSERSLLPYLFDIDMDGDIDMFSYVIYSVNDPKNLRILKNSTF